MRNEKKEGRKITAINDKVATFLLKS